MDEKLIKSELVDAWKNVLIPQRQYQEVVLDALEKYRNGLSIEVFDVLVNILKDNILELNKKTLLEIGCASGYYSEVLRLKGIDVEYHGCDYSVAYIDFARKLYPEIDFQVQDARFMTYPDKHFDIVVLGGCLLHIKEFDLAIAEAARIAKNYVISHRTPIWHKKETSFHIKVAYGVEMFEIHFNERELLKLFRKNSLKIIDIITYNFGFQEGLMDVFTYKTYLCIKD